MYDKIDTIIQILEYWNGISECECNSEYPIGGCLKCDTEEALKIAREIKSENEKS